LEFLAWLQPELTRAEWIAHAIIFAVNILLLLLAKPLLSLIKVDESNKITVRIFRSVNIIILALHLLDIVLLRFSDIYEHAFIKLGLSLAAVYGALYLYNLMCYLSRKRFGHVRTIDEDTIYLDTYSSRLVDLLGLIFIVIAAIYTLIKIWGADSMLETTGIFGIVAAFLAFTSGNWAPDIFSGLIILNSRMLEDGDLVIIDGYPDEFVISKVTLIYVVVYNVRKNHRSMIRNSQFIRSKIDNLSRIASTDGLRQALNYNIGYPRLKGTNAEERGEELKRFQSRVGRIFSKAFEVCSEDKQIKINRDKPFEWALTQSGDHALQYTVWIFLERVPNTKITATVRKHVMGTIYAINTQIFLAAEAEGVSLATPVLNHVTLEQNANASS